MTVWPDVTEQWLPVPGFEGRYDVSDLGRVRSWVRWLREPDAALPRILSPGLSSAGYPQVVLSKPRVTRTVRDLVACAFHGSRPDGMEVRHLNGDSTDARACNLAYGTSSENNHDIVRHGRNPQAAKTHCDRGHEFTPENTYREPGRAARKCRKCITIRTAAWRRRKDSAAKAQGVSA